MSRVLFISSEAYPLVKTGGLADVAGSLPRALMQRKQDVRLLLPAYPQVMQQVNHYKVVAESSHYGHPVRILQTLLPGTRVKTWLVDCDAAFNRVGNPYVDADGEPWPDNAFRFALFAQVAVDIAVNRIKLDWSPDIVHGNDWQCGLVPALLSAYQNRPATVFTIHNMAYQGLFPAKQFFDLGLPDNLWGLNGLEFHHQFSFIKGGLVYSDRINTVSPTYAREIQTPQFGYGLDGLLRFRSHRLNGILNGIDTDVWNPGTDPLISHKYNRRNLPKKVNNKLALQKQLGLPVDASIPMLGMISRLVEQKGVDAILTAMPELIKHGVQLVILGSGERHYEKALADWSKWQPQQISVTIGYDERLSHQIEAASDSYLMPSLFEPCGLNQLYSLRYGTLPVAGNVGGLADSVIDYDKITDNRDIANGFLMDGEDANALVLAIRRMLDCYQQQDCWRSLQLNAMSIDWSWQSSADQYLELYQKAIKDHPRII